MKLSRKWLNEFVDLPLQEIDDRAFDEAMTVSGSKVEVTEDLSQSMKNVKVGRILSLEKHPNSDHMLVAQLDVGEAEPVQICTGAWNVHVGDLVPAALHNAAKTTFLASVALVFLTVTSPPIVAPEFLRTSPSILITPRPISVWEGRAIAAVLLSPTISIRSLSLIPKSSMTFGSSLATP